MHTDWYGTPIAMEFICYNENETQLNRKTCSQMGILNSELFRCLNHIYIHSNLNFTIYYPIAENR